MQLAKVGHRALFLALQADAKSYPGGISSLAKVIGLNANTLANGLNPDHESPPPSFTAVLEVIVLAQSKRSIFYLASLVNQTPVDMEIDHMPQKEAINLFLDLMQKISPVMSEGSQAAKDGRFCPEERKSIEPLLMNLAKTCFELLYSIRNGQ